MTGSCCASNDNITILACSGASNVGQLSNQAVVELTQEGFGKMFCLAGIGGLLSGFLRLAKDDIRDIRHKGTYVSYSVSNAVFMLTDQSPAAYHGQADSRRRHLQPFAQG